MVSGQKINNGVIAVSMSSSAEENNKEQVYNEGSKFEEEKQEKIMQSDNLDDKVEDVMPSIEDHEDVQNNVSDQHINGDNDTEEVNISSVIEKPGDQVEISEEQIEVLNKKLEVPVETNHNDAQAIVQVPQAYQILNINPTSPMKELHDLVSHNIKDTIVHACSDEIEADLKNTDTTEALAKALEHVVVEAGLSPKSHMKDNLPGCY
ncbi:hypothetical protein K7X08_002765 [Anisodus acutangulus]|uniref:Uncharacterized protein n=1 Tax=Anisodus acutangulus TaxID=402998 RepID=A0A9Q1MCZ0_9SOLA|nr:hypothetical protein K7X08_002765 [Anisodus acutangulus]